MTDQERKAMQMALKALEFAASEIYNEHNDDVIAEAIKALRQALAQPANQSDCGHTEYKPFCQMCMATKQKPEQEPVAFEDWLKNQHGDPEEIGFLQALRVTYYAGADSHPAPPSKPWVSLTDEEIDYIYKQNHNQYGEDITGEYERELEAKLREKNT